MLQGDCRRVKCAVLQCVLQSHLAVLHTVHLLHSIPLDIHHTHRSLPHRDRRCRLSCRNLYHFVILWNLHTLYQTSHTIVGWKCGHSKTGIPPSNWIPEYWSTNTLATPSKSLVVAHALTTNKYLLPAQTWQFKHEFHSESIGKCHGRVKLGQHSPPPTLGVAQHGFLGLSGTDPTCLLACPKEFFGFLLCSGEDMAFDSFSQMSKSSLLGQGLQTEIPGYEKGISTKALYNFVD